MLMPIPPLEYCRNENCRSILIRGCCVNRACQYYQAIGEVYRDKGKDRHPNSARFHEVLNELGDLHDLKQRDYGRGDDPFANVRASKEWGLPAWAGAMIRVDDKVRRLQNLIKNGQLSCESAVDSFKDIAVYAVIALCLYEEEQRDE